MKISNVTAIVTGGASGLGFAVTENLIQNGARVVVLDLPKPESEAKIKSLGGNATFSGGDVTQSEDVQKAIRVAQEKFGSIQAAINCAGIVFGAKTVSRGEACPLEIFEKTLQVNLIGTFNVCRLVATAISKQEASPSGERGVLINTSSIAAFDGQMGQTAYSASKGGIAALTLPMARDLSALGIRVMSIAPGIFHTPMMDSLPEAAQKSLAEQVPFPKRLGNPNEFAQLAMHIIQNPMLNGEVIRLDGALRMGIK